MTTLPGDPREDSGIEDVDAEDLIRLKSNAMLWMKFLNYNLYFLFVHNPA